MAGWYNRNGNAPYLSKAVGVRCLCHPNVQKPLRPFVIYPPRVALANAHVAVDKALTDARIRELSLAAEPGTGLPVVESSSILRRVGASELPDIVKPLNKPTLKGALAAHAA